MPYREIQCYFDALFPKGRDRCYWKSLYLRALADEAIGAIVGHLARRPSEMTLGSIWALGGAMQRVPEAATAFGDRTAPYIYMLSLDAIWSEPTDDAANVDWARTAWTDMRRHGNGRMYLNFPGHGEGDDLVHSALGPDVYARLARVKRIYDQKFRPESFPQVIASTIAHVEEATATIDRVSARRDNHNQPEGGRL
jgi:hypothetical protein